MNRLKTAAQEELVQIYVDRGLDEDLARKVWRPASCNRGMLRLGTVEQG